MKEIELKTPPLFKNNIEIEDSDLNIDLHNDYYCTEVIHVKSSNFIQMSFNKCSTSPLFDKVIVVLTDVEIVKMSLFLNNFHDGKITLDTFYRGRFEVDGSLFEYSKMGNAYYYVDFYESYSMEIFAHSVKILLYNSGEAT
jgi:hypothetical protein